MFEWVDAGLKKMKWYDMSMVKLSTAAFVLMIATLWQPLLSLEWYWYAIIGVVAAVKPMMLFFKK